MTLIQPLTRHSALRSWRAFFPRVTAYAAERNHIRVGHENVSQLGASIRFRTLLEDEIIEETLAGYSFREAEKWLQEVCWRRYWKGWLEMRPQIWKQYRLRLRALQEELPKETLARAQAVMAGGSGVACMDKIAQELVMTGYLHNHARMWWASFWIHVEKLPWELGADFFFRHLLDADPASNTLSWRWVAGLQTPGKTYLVRLSNVTKYAPVYVRENSEGHERIADDVVTAWRPLEDYHVEKKPLPDYPATFYQTSKAVGLWLHADDLVPEIGPLAHLTPRSIAVCISDRVYTETYQLSGQRIASLRTVLLDGLNRAAAHYGCPALVFENEDPVKGLCSWAKERGLTEIVAFAPMVGPVGDLLPRLRSSLKMLGVRLILIRRFSDQTAFSYVTAGFFPFWQKMSRHLRFGSGFSNERRCLGE